MVKVGDKIRSVTDRDYGISVGSIYVVENVRNMGDSSYVWFNDSNDNQRMRNFRHYELVTETPPATIQHEGYNYTRGEPVVPAWVKDGAWVINKITGVIAQLSEERLGFNANYLSGMSCNLSASDVSERFRPFTNSDWKWGMWAEYKGEKVFVSGVGGRGINASSKTDCLFFIPFSEITPTTAP